LAVLKIFGKLSRALRAEKRKNPRKRERAGEYVINDLWGLYRNTRKFGNLENGH
jgi:hypothetical protein